jgi:Leucine-rich repeat (LRR) protein
MYVNASRNFNLVCIRGLEDHCHLVELIISHTSVSDLSPLNSCPSLEILDIENCSEV